LRARSTRPADTDKWIRGTAETGPALVAEGWDFKAHSIGNRELFAYVIQRGSHELVQFFIHQRAPALDPPEKGPSPLAVAASTGNSALVTQLIGKKRHLPAPLLACALLGAASSGDLTTLRWFSTRVLKSMVRSVTIVSPSLRSSRPRSRASLGSLMKFSNIIPDVNGRGPYGQTALSLFLERGLNQNETPQIVYSLVAAGADVNVRGEYDGETPIFKVCDFHQLVPVLLKAGADVNAQDKFGRNALTSCGDHDYLNALIAAGADLSHRDKRGRTAAEAARQLGDTETATFLEMAEKRAQ
jgi:ankyrin repeat protein